MKVLVAIDDAISAKVVCQFHFSGNFLSCSMLSVNDQKLGWGQDKCSSLTSL